MKQSGSPYVKSIFHLSRLQDPELKEYLGKIDRNEITGDFRLVDLEKIKQDAEMEMLVNHREFNLEQLYFNGKPTNRGRCSYCSERKLGSQTTSIWALGDKKTKLKRQNIRSHLLRYHVDQPRNGRGRILAEKLPPTKNIPNPFFSP